MASFLIQMMTMGANERWDQMDERHASFLFGLPKLPRPEKGRELDVSKNKKHFLTKKMQKTCCLAMLALHWAQCLMGWNSHSDGKRWSCRQSLCGVVRSEDKPFACITKCMTVPKGSLTNALIWASWKPVQLGKQHYTTQLLVGRMLY